MDTPSRLASAAPVRTTETAFARIFSRAIRTVLVGGSGQRAGCPGVGQAVAAEVLHAGAAHRRREVDQVGEAQRAADRQRARQAGIADGGQATAGVAAIALGGVDLDAVVSQAGG